MAVKYCLIIDDENQEGFFNPKVKDKLYREKGLKVEGIFFDITDKEILDENLKIKKAELQSKIIQTIKGKNIDLIACDYNLTSDDHVNGLDVISLIREKKKNVPIILYSAKLDFIIKNLIKDYTEGKYDQNNFFKKLKQLFRTDIKDFVRRDNYPDTINNILKNPTNELEQVFLQKLREYSDMKFKTCYPKFRGKYLGEIADEIDSDNYHGKEFKTELVEQTVCHLIKLNEE